MSAISSLISNAQSNSTTSLLNTGNNSLSLLSQGNVQGAVSNLLNAPGDILNSVMTNGSSSPGNGLGGLQARGDALQSWCWYCSMPPITNSSALSFGTSVPLIGTLAPVVTLPGYYVQTAGLPTRTIVTDSIQRNGHAVHYPESYSVDDVTLGLFLDTTGKAMQYLLAWQGLVLKNQNPKLPSNQGRWGLPAKYKKDIILTCVSPSKQQMLSFRLINCFPKSTAPIALAYTDANAMVEDVSFCVEDVDIIVSNDKGFIDNLLSTATGYAMGALSNVTTGLVNQLSQSINSYFP